MTIITFNAVTIMKEDFLHPLHLLSCQFKICLLSSNCYINHYINYIFSSAEFALM